MTIKLHAIIDTLETWAPPELAESWDNCGLLLGDPDKDVNSILIRLDCDLRTLGFVTHHKPDLVITHHPIFFKPVRKIAYQSDVGQLLHAFIKGNTHLFCMHTNLDAAKDGVNDQFIRAFDLDPKKAQPLSEPFGAFFDGIRLDKKTVLSKLPGTFHEGSDATCFNRVGFLAGSGHGFVQTAIDKKLDCFVTGELTYHDSLTLNMNGISAYTVGHKESEVFILPTIEEKLRQKWPDLAITILK